MSPTPVTYASPVAPASYSWEATDEEVSARYDVPVDEIVRFDLNTSPTPPELALRVLRGGRFETPLSEYPPSDYRRLVEAAAARYGVGRDELLVGAGADEILDLIGKAFLPPGGSAIVPAPTYAMYRVVTEQRGARPAAVPRRPASEGWRLDAPAVRDAAREAEVVWLCNPNNPTGTAEPDGLIEALLADLAGDAARDDRTPPIVVLDEAYAEFVGRSLVDLRHAYPRLVVVRTASKAYGLAGLRVGFAIAQAEVIAAIAPYRPPGSVSTASVTVVTEALLASGILDANLARVEQERDRLSADLAGIGWRVGPSVTNFLLVTFGSPAEASRAAEALLRRGLVPRTFGEGHPLAASLRITVRDRAANARFVDAARAVVTATPAEAPA
jgi:histidinol-phosphate aminotransferase